MRNIRVALRGSAIMVEFCRHGREDFPCQKMMNAFTAVASRCLKDRDREAILP